jgi:hypothetical protein
MFFVEGWRKKMSDLKFRKPFRGRIEIAEYKDVGIDHYKGFPFIEALPEIMDGVEVVKKIKLRPRFNPEELFLSAVKRKHCVERLSTFIIPLHKHLEVEEKMSMLIRKGYLSRNIANNDNIRRLRYAMMHFQFPDTAEREKDKYNIPSPTSSGLGIIGISGAGKSSGMMRILNMYPQIILHPQYEEKQLVWLKVDCSVTGTIKQLCIFLIQEFSEIMGDVPYNDYKYYKTDELIPVISSLALKHHLGVLIIDEIQYLSETKSGGVPLMLNFFNTLINTIGVPVVLIGTPKAEQLFTKEFRNTKRITDQGSVSWDRLARNSSDWDTLITYIWQYQWTLSSAIRTTQLEDALYYESQGIPDLVIKIFKQAQKRVIGNGAEFITSEVIHSVAQDEFKLLQPALQALRSGKKEEMLKYLDIFMSPEPKKLITKQDKDILAKDFNIAIEDILEEQGQQEKIEDVIRCLMEIDIPEEEAIKITHRTQSEDIVAWKQDALSMALQKQGQNQSITANEEAVFQSKPDSSKHKSNSEKKSRKGQRLLNILGPKMKKQNETFYSLLKGKGVIQDVRNTLKLE